MVSTHLDICDDGHGNTHVVEGVEQQACAVAHVQRGTQLAEQIVGLFGKVNVDMFGEAGQVQEVVHGDQAGLLDVELGDVTDMQQGFEIAKGNCWEPRSIAQRHGAASQTHLAIRSGRRRGRCGRRHTLRVAPGS